MSSYTFVDSRVPDYDLLLANRVPDGRTVILDSSTDGIDQIVAALTGVTGLDAIHIVSHGAEGTLYLGSTVLSSANVANYSSQLAMIGAALGSDGDILLYGCNVASGTSGRNFIDDLARHTGADVAASLDATGATALGGNWVLESSTGPIEAPSLSAPTYEALLATPVITITDVTVGEMDGFARFTVSLSESSASTVSVNYATFNGTATGSNFDYGSTGTQTLNFAPGEMVKTVRVSIINDTGVEPTENFVLGLSSPVNAVIGRSFGTATIVDNDAVSGTPLVSITDFVVDEQDKEASFVITLDRPSAGAVSMSYATADGTAVAGSDYVAASGTVSFAAGETAKTVKVTLINDAVSELSESFNLVLSGLSGGTTLDGTGTAIIAENDAPTVNTPYLTVDDVTVGESQPYADFLVRLNAPSASTVSVNYATFNGTATGSNFDYGSTGTQTLNFAPGEMVKTVRVSIINDTGVEPTENFVLGLSSPVNAVIGRPFGTATIVDNDAVSGTPVVSITDFVVDEQDRQASFIITLDRPSTGAVSMSYATADGTAVAGSDYVAASGTVSFAAGETAKTVKVTLIDDAVSELSESFNLVLSGLSGGTTLDGTGTAIIAENDAPTVNTPYLTVDDVTVGESQPYADFLVRLNAPSASTVSVNYATSNGTATGSNFDYGSTGTQTLNFAPGEMVKTVRVSIINDTGVEPTENFVLGVSSPVNAVIGRPFGTATIVDNDAVSGTPVLNVRDTVVDEKDSTARIVLTLDRPSTSAVTMSIGVQDLNTTAGSDYLAFPGQTIAFAPGETAKTFVIGLVDDGLAEPTEAVDVIASNVSGATVSDGIGRVYIAANDAVALSTPVITVANATASEDYGYLDFLVALNAPGTNPVSVNYATSNGTATGSNFDYGSTGTQTLNFAPGEMVKTVRISLTDDSNVESTENFTLNLSSPVGATLGNTAATGFIIDDDSAPPASVMINGTGGPDILRGTAFADTLVGGNGNDFLDGGSAADTASGGDGNDILTGGPGADMLTGGPGADIFLDTPANLDLDQLPDFTAEDLMDVAGVRFSGVRYTSSSGLLELDTAGNGSYATRLTLPTGLSGEFSATPSPAGGAASTRIQLGSGTDTDGDGVPDSRDNAILVPNPDQRDTDADGYGNVADPDLNNDKIVSFADLALLKERFFGGNADADFDGNGVVNFADLAIMKAMFFGPPGPSYVDLPPPGVSPQGLTEELAIPDSGHVEVAIVGSTADVAG